MLEDQAYSSSRQRRDRDRLEQVAGPAMKQLPRQTDGEAVMKSPL
jgi:hypothetical protein